jgi:hypothetical protein
LLMRQDGAGVGARDALGVQFLSQGSELAEYRLADLFFHTVHCAVPFLLFIFVTPIKANFSPD